MGWGNRTLLGKDVLCSVPLGAHCDRIDAFSPSAAAVCRWSVCAPISARSCWASEVTVKAVIDRAIEPLEGIWRAALWAGGKAPAQAHAPPP